MVLTKQMIYIVNVKTMRKIFSNYMCFSESLNFKLQTLDFIGIKQTKGFILITRF